MVKKFLNVGSGAKGSGEIPEWLKSWHEVRLDVDPTLRPDIVGSVIDMREVSDQSFDGIWAANIVEHLYAHEVQPALSEIFRVLKPDGHVEIKVPNLLTVAQLIVNGKLEEVAYTSPDGPIAPIDIIFGHRAAIAKGRTYMAHRTGFTPQSIGNAVTAAGFKSHRLFVNEFDILVFAAKEVLSNETVPEGARSLPW